MNLESFWQIKNRDGVFTSHTVYTKIQCISFLFSLTKKQDKPSWCIISILLHFLNIFSEFTLTLWKRGICLVPVSLFDVMFWPIIFMPKHTFHHLFTCRFSVLHLVFSVLSATSFHKTIYSIIHGKCLMIFLLYNWKTQ